MRNALASILARNNLRAKMIDQLEDALEFISCETPALIISEFRVPSMAAKVLVEKLKALGKDVPVLVTTTQQGENANQLVTKLGVSGYISKPLNPDRLVAAIQDRLSGRTAKLA